MTSELLALIAAHFACTDTAAHRPMTLDEVHRCAAVYQAVKLGFIPGVNATDYADLSLDERIAVSRAGFLTFLNWRQANPDVVHHLQRVARGNAAPRFSD